MAVASSIIAASIVAGSAIASAKIASNANKKATDAQAAGTENALNFTKEAYNREQQQLAPYVNAGGAAVSKLSSLMGLGGQPAPYTATDPSHIPPGANFPASWVANSKPTLPMGNAMLPQPGPGQAGQTPGGVTMRAPDGSQRTVPTSMVAEAQAKGCTVVSGPIQRTSGGGQ